MYVHICTCVCVRVCVRACVHACMRVCDTCLKCAFFCSFWCSFAWFHKTGDHANRDTFFCLLFSCVHSSRRFHGSCLGVVNSCTQFMSLYASMWMIHTHINCSKHTVYVSLCQYVNDSHAHQLFKAHSLCFFMPVYEWFTRISIVQSTQFMFLYASIWMIHTHINCSKHTFSNNKHSMKLWHFRIRFVILRSKM